MDIASGEKLVVGDTIERSLPDFIQACALYIQIEQRQPTPDSALISLLCDAVRLARESERQSRTLVTELTMMDGA